MSIGQCYALCSVFEFGIHQSVTCIVVDLLIQVPHELGAIHRVRYAVGGGELSITCGNILISCDLPCLKFRINEVP